MSDESDDELLTRAWASFCRARDRWYAPPLVSAVVAASRLVMQGLNSIAIDGLERFNALRDRGGRGLLTFSNHVSIFDDPWIISCLGLGDISSVRWVAAEARNFFDTPLKSGVFGAGRCVPVVRGLGLDQPGFHFLAERLQAGDWVHLFPEGGRTRASDARLRTPFKPGMARLIELARPWALPFYHAGMERVLPVGARVPQRGQRVRVLFGEATLMDETTIAGVCTRQGVGVEPTDRQRLAALTAWSQEALEHLQSALLGRPDVG